MTTSFDLNSILRENIKNIKAYASARDEFVSDGTPMIFLDANENPFESQVNRYPDPKHRELKSVLSKIKNVNPKHIVFGNGSDEILDLLFRAFCNPSKDSVMILPPTYGMYQVLADLNDINLQSVPLDENFQPRVEEILEQINSNTKILFLCSPNNPTGNLFEHSRIETLLKEFKGVIVIDEAYIDFANTESWINHLDQYPNLFVTQTFSKAFGLAGVRLGIGYGSEKIIEIFHKIKAPYNINTLSQQKALERLKDIESVDKEIKTLLQQRDFLIKELSKIKFISKIYPSDANFVLIKVDDANKRYKELLEKGIVARNRTTQTGCKNTLRISIGTALENKKILEIFTQMS